MLHPHNGKMCALWRTKSNLLHRKPKSSICASQAKAKRIILALGETDALCALMTYSLTCMKSLLQAKSSLDHFKFPLTILVKKGAAFFPHTSLLSSCVFVVCVLLKKGYTEI